MSQDNPFELLGLPVSYDIDEKALRASMLSQASKHHPDRFSDPLDQVDAASRLAVINQAYDRLRHPLSRAQAVLEVLGGTISTDAEDSKHLPPDLLMEMMEVREELEDALTTNDQPQIARLRQWALDRRDEYEQQLSQALRTAAQEQDDQVDSSAYQLDEARKQLNALRYIQRMLDQLPPV